MPPRRAGAGNNRIGDRLDNRVTTTTVEFIHPFFLDEIERELPAGQYTVETEEEALDSASFLAWRRVATNLFVRPDQRSTAAQMWAIHPESLEAALKRDRLPAA